MTSYWFFLSDPEDYHLDQLFARKSDRWDGVMGAAAQKYLAQIRKGDRILGYHTAPEKNAYAMLEAAGNPYQNPELEEKNWVIDVRALEKFSRPVPLAELKANPRLRGMKLFQLFRPIAVSPLTESEFDKIRRLGALET